MSPMENWGVGLPAAVAAGQGLTEDDSIAAVGPDSAVGSVIDRVWAEVSAVEEALVAWLEGG